jgi:hypothetical protein
VSADFRLHAITCLDAPQYRPREMTLGFWKGLAHYQATLVSFNGRGFDVPILELAAFRFGVTARGHFEKFGRRYRYGETHLDLNDWLSNHGKPGKMSTTGQDVWQLFCDGRIREINDYCMFDVLDTYFVFLRTRVMTGELTLEAEQQRVDEARDWITAQLEAHPHLQQYLDNWGEWKLWVA